MESKRANWWKFFNRALRDFLRYVRDVFWIFEAPHDESLRDLSGDYRKEIPGFPFVSAWAAYAYSKPFADDLKLFKYRAERSVMEKFDSGLKDLAASCTDTVPKNAFVAYPPSPVSRTLLRWYDHTALLAERFAKHAGFPVVRIIRTPFFRAKQSVRGQAERMSNVSNKFFLPAWTKAYSWRPAIFFDDVISSGSTALECAKILAGNGNTELYGFFLASSTYGTERASYDLASERTDSVTETRPA